MSFEEYLIKYYDMKGKERPTYIGFVDPQKGSHLYNHLKRHDIKFVPFRSHGAKGKFQVFLVKLDWLMQTFNDFDIVQEQSPFYSYGIDMDNIVDKVSRCGIVSDLATIKKWMEHERDLLMKRVNTMNKNINTICTCIQ